MMCASYDQLKVGATYMNKSKKSVIHMDSSGKFLKQGKGKKKLLNTAIVIPPAAPGHAPFPILELISEKNKTIDYKIFLQEGWSFLSTAVGDNEVSKPDIAVTDCSFPNIHSLMSVFNNTKLSDYLEECYQSFMNNTELENKTKVTLCINHLLPIILKTARASGTEKVVADSAVAAIMQVMQAKSMAEALEVWGQVVTIFCSKENTDDVQKARDYLKTKSKGDISEMDDPLNFNYDFEDGTEKSEETEYGNRKLLRVNSPFFALFKRHADKVTKAQEHISRTTNPLYAPQCLAILNKQYLSLFPLLSASLLEGADLYTNANIELYWQSQRRLVKDIPDRLMWPPRYLGKLLHNARSEAKNMLLHKIIPTLKFGGKIKAGKGEIHFGDYIDDEEEEPKLNFDKNVFKPTPSKSEKKKRKAKESFYGCQEEWNSQKKRTPKKSNYIKNKTIDFDSIFGRAQPDIDIIRVTGCKKHLGGIASESETLAPMAVQLRKDDISFIQNTHQYLSTDGVDAGLCLLDRKLNEESNMSVTVYSTQNCRLIHSGEQRLVQPGKFITIIPRSFGINEEASRLARTSDREPGSHFTLVSNLFCGSQEVKVYETFQPFRNAENLLTADGKRLIKLLCNTENELTVSCVNVAEQVESECGALSVALGVHLCSEENEIYNNIIDVRSTYLNCLQKNRLSNFKMSKRDVNNQKNLFSYKI